MGGLLEINPTTKSLLGDFPGGPVVKNLPGYAGDAGLIPGSRRSPGEENGNPPPGLPGKSHGQRSMEGYSPWGRKEVRHDLVTEIQRD